MSDGEHAHNASGFSSRSRETLSAVGRHDGHTEGNLNCIAMRHGWSRTFSLAPEEVSTLSYDTLARALDLHTLNLRPMIVRILVEHPPGSGNWAKIRPFKYDSSLQSVLVRDFFEGRRREGTLTVVEIRDGADRREEGDGLSLRSVSSRVGSRIFHPQKESLKGKQPSSWLGRIFSRQPVPKVPASESTTQLQDIGSDAEGEDDGQAPVPPPKKSSSLFGGGLFSYILGAPAPPPKAPSPPPEERAEAEADVMRKRGWLPPGMMKRQTSLRHRLSSKRNKDKGENPFLTGKKDTAGADPFEDPEPGDEDAEEIRDVDDFFEMERPDGSDENVGSKEKGKAWSRFTPKRKPSKGKGKAKAVEPSTPPPQSAQTSDVE
ncbi:hypothetical protein CYLTODRAFT_417513 [Cylindrobasidium torrendii FP15055 ss-10]|uniref:Uncharacterized protein n=1 Tax=Cylindrobasidium torrendii FP15055 ss-10 TaxID=1314674 RepID=A0A0D7BR33_9AGAR|nr:hypothetical protein CYLTODRAFT_417513 [Cylindrobasidium torrendii FP15055 ss-10]